MELFDFIDAIFSVPLWKEVTDSDKKKHFFMAQRFLSMKFPMQTQYFNQINTNPIAAMNTWHIMMSRQFKSKPSWMYDYGKVNKKEVEKKKKLDISPKAIVMYKNNYMMSTKDYNFMMEMFPEEVIPELQVYEEYVD